MNNRKWTYDLCLAEAKNFDSLKNWKLGHPKSFDAARRMNSHRRIAEEAGLKTSERWTYDSCLKASKPYGTLGEWARVDQRGYLAAIRHGWLEKIVLARPELRARKPNGYWTFEKCLEDARLHGPKWSHNGARSSYSTARDNKWLTSIREQL